MPIIQELTIKGFKSIWDQTINLGNVNVFIGTNGAGKSNLLEALGMLSAAAAGKIDYLGLAQRGVRLSSPEVFRSAFGHCKRQNFLTLEARTKDFLYKIDLNTSIKKDEDSWTFLTEKLQRGDDFDEIIAARNRSGQKIQGAKELKNLEIGAVNSIIPFLLASKKLLSKETRLIQSLVDYAIFSPSTPILRGVSPDESKKAPLGLYGGNLAQAFTDILKQKESRDELQNFLELLVLFDSVEVKKPHTKLQSNHIHTGNKVLAFVDKYMPKDFKKLYAYDVSEGALYILFVIALLTHKNAPGFFALDNIDNALNPNLVRNLMSHIVDHTEENKERQIFMTTHNPTTLDALDIFNDANRLYVVSRNEETGFTQFERIQPPPGFTKEKWAQEYGDMKLSEIWLSGMIRGLAPLKDHRQ